MNAPTQPGAADVQARVHRGWLWLLAWVRRKACGSEMCSEGTNPGLDPARIALEGGFDGDVRQSGGVHALDIAEEGVCIMPGQHLDT